MKPSVCSRTYVDSNDKFDELSRLALLLLLHTLSERQRWTTETNMVADRVKTTHAGRLHAVTAARQQILESVARARGSRNGRKTSVIGSITRNPDRRSGPQNQASGRLQRERNTTDPPTSAALGKPRVLEDIRAGNTKHVDRLSPIHESHATQTP